MPEALMSADIALSRLQAKVLVGVVECDAGGAAQCYVVVVHEPGIAMNLAKCQFCRMGCGLLLYRG
jgi:hypothetical protein